MDALRHGKFRWVALLSVICLGLAVAGCEGDDGDNGAPGATGDAGLACWDLNENGVPDLPDEDLNGDGVVDVLDCNALANPPPGGGLSDPVESCAVCHSEGSIGDADAAHEVTGVPTVSDVAFTVADPNLAVTFNLKIDGRNASADDGFVLNAADRLFESAPDEYTLEELEDAGTPAVLSGGDNGNFTITVEGGAVNALTNSRYEFRVQKGERPDRVRALVVADYPDVAYVDLVTNQACQNCHSELGSGIHRSYPMGASQCVVCHSSDLGRYEGRFQDPFVGIIHGIHNAHGFPEGFYAYEDDIFETTYPTYMNNCSVCHSEPDMLAAANSMPVDDETCFTCHGTTETMFPDPEDPVGQFHAGITDGCEACHNPTGPASNYLVVTDVHNGETTERGGIIWDGVDTAVTEGAKFVWEITGVADDGTNLTITWQATYDGVGVDPCNDTVGPGAPVFHLPGGGGGGNFSILRNYAQGEDFILGTDPNEAGQPGSAPPVDETNTTCSGNVATTVVPVEETDAMYGRVGIQGKPAVVSIDPADTDGLMRVRAKSPTFDWTIGDDVAAPARRALVDTTDKCLKCHVGSMYQHGGNRVDNVDLCLLCHNTAANEAFVRDGFGVDESEAYDGRSGQNFGMREMLHAVHSAGETEAPIVIYRGRGIYAWADNVGQLPNWPTEPDCVYGNNDSPGNIVFGSDADTATERLCQPHNFHTPTYPRELNDCAACHVEDFAVMPDATKAMASTVETGDPPFGDQLNDVLEGITASSCMTCHRSGDPAVESALKAHAYQNGWTPQAFEEGRQTIIDAVK